MIQNINILIVDDDEDDFFITSQYIMEIHTFNTTCDWCYSIPEARKKLRSNAYDIYLLDYRLGALTGLDLLKEAIAGGTYKPIILLTGKGTPEIDNQSIEAGAYDYLTKAEINPEKLERCFRYTLERYKSFKLINDNEKKFRHIFLNALSFIFTCTDLLVFTECNPAVESFLGYSPEELKGTSLLRYVNENDRDSFIKIIQARKNIRNVPLHFISKSGDSRSGSISLSYFEDENYEVVWQGIVYDETLRHQLEQTKLQSQKIDATYRLVRTLAHEIRNPLTNIGLSIESLKKTEEPEDKDVFLNIMNRSYVRINDILTELLQSSSTVELKPELADLKDLINEVLDKNLDRIKLSNVQLQTNYPDFPVVKIIDREKFALAITNLVVNAVEAMDKEERILNISLNKTLDQTVIQIKDNGKGIGNDEMKRLFEPYYTTKKSGMGLGLVSTLNIIKSHKAIIEVDSRPNTGTAFRIVFSE